MRRALLAVGTALLLAAPPVLADPTPSPTPVPEAPLTVVVKTLLPRAPQRGDAFEVTGVIRNDGNETVRDVRVRLALGAVIKNRSDLDAADTDRPDTDQRTITRKLETGQTLDLKPGEQHAFDFRTDVDSLGIREIGVYPLDIQARGDLDSGAGQELLGLAPTFVPFFNDANPTQNKVAVLWPVVDRPHQTSTGTFLDDDLAGSFATRDGRLSHLVQAARAAEDHSCDTHPALRNDGTRTLAPTRCEGVPVSLGVDPDVVAAAATMAGKNGYQVRVDGSSQAGKGGAAAATWLEQLRQGVASSDRSILALPYADPDVDALAKSAAGRKDLADAITFGRQVLVNQLSPQQPIDVVWPPAGVVSQAAVEALPLTPHTAFVLDESAYPDPETPPNKQPSAMTTLNYQASVGGFYPTGLVVDSTLSDLITGPSTNTRGIGPRLAEQRFIAETAIIAAEKPHGSRTFLIAPDRDADASVLSSSQSLLDIGRLPWLCGVGLQAVAQGTARCQDDDGSTASPTPSASPADDGRSTLRTSEVNWLSQGFLSGIGHQRNIALQLTGAVLDGADTADKTTIAVLRSRLNQAVFRAESSAWRDDVSGGQRQVDSLIGSVKAYTDRITLNGGRVLLTSSKGTLTVGVQNTLELPIQVRVHFHSDAPFLDSTTQVITVGSKRALTASVKADAGRAGKFVVVAQLLDRSGLPFNGDNSKKDSLQRAAIDVRSTQYGRLALGITFAAAAILFIAAGARIVRRSLRRPPASEAT